MAPDQGRGEEPVGHADGQRPRPNLRPEREAHRSDSGTLWLRPRTRGTGSAEFQGGARCRRECVSDATLITSDEEGPRDRTGLPDDPPAPMPPPTPPTEPPPRPVIDPPPEPKPKGPFTV